MTALWIVAFVAWALWWAGFAVSELRLRRRGETVEVGWRSPQVWWLFLLGVAWAVYGLLSDGLWPDLTFAIIALMPYGITAARVVQLRMSRRAQRPR